MYSLFLTNEPSNNKEWTRGAAKNEQSAEGREKGSWRRSVCRKRANEQQKNGTNIDKKISKIPEHILENMTAKEYKLFLFTVFTNTSVLLSL